MARFGMSPGEFLEITPLEFYNAIKEFDEVEISKIKPVAEAIRMSTWWLVSVQLPKKKRIRKPERLWTYPWDQTKKKPQSPAEMKNVMGIIVSATKNQKKKVEPNKAKK